MTTPIKIQDMETQITRRANVEAMKDLAYRAMQWTSFDPDKRGEQLMDSCEIDLQRYLAQIPEEMHETFEAKYIELYRQWLGAMSRCMSSMITGPAKFPTARAERNNNYEMNARKRMEEWAEKFVKRCNRQQRLTGWAEVERLTEKIETLQTLHENMKAANKIARSKKSEVEKLDELIALGFSEKTANRICICGGFGSYTLSNNLAKIKDAQTLLARHQRMATSEDKEMEINGVKVIICNSEERLRLVFNGKPDAETISRLKQNAFKWSPSNMAWQRQLTSNAYRGAAAVLNASNTSEEWLRIVTQLRNNQ